MQEKYSRGKEIEDAVECGRAFFFSEEEISKDTAKFVEFEGDFDKFVKWR